MNLFIDYKLMSTFYSNPIPIPILLPFFLGINIPNSIETTNPILGLLALLAIALGFLGAYAVACIAPYLAAKRGAEKSAGLKLARLALDQPLAYEETLLTFQIESLQKDINSISSKITKACNKKSQFYRKKIQKFRQNIDSINRTEP